jgi:hypothetical protein
MATAKVKHVYAGPKDPLTGEMIEEPVYVHVDYPRMLYHPDYDGWPASGKMFETAEGVAEALADGWVKTPVDKGIVTAPSREQIEADKLAAIKAKAKGK